MKIIKKLHLLENKQHGILQFLLIFTFQGEIIHTLIMRSDSKSKGTEPLWICTCWQSFIKNIKKLHLLENKQHEILQFLLIFTSQGEITQAPIMRYGSLSKGTEPLWICTCWPSFITIIKKLHLLENKQHEILQFSPIFINFQTSWRDNSGLGGAIFVKIELNQAFLIMNRVTNFETDI